MMRSAETPIGLVVGGNEVPRIPTGGGLLHHVLDRRLVVLPAASVAEILVRELPALERIGEPAAKPAHLLVRRDMHKELHQPTPSSSSMRSNSLISS